MEGRRVDEYGNPVLRVDEYGNPIHDQPSAYSTGGTGGYGHNTGGHGTGTGAGGYGTGTGAGGYGTGTGAGGYGTTQLHEGTGGQHQPMREKEGHGGGILHRSGSSSSSSSSEDDGMGGRRKKSIKEKIKEKLPGAHKTDEQHKTTTTVPSATMGTGAEHYGEEHEKKGIMEKIKEKLPGHH
ncbi:hypothetical protein LUZ61_008167 [Rhynchospora tenuis]|uniref:Dehydrin n=1 Tax=Rhynchospora tenuis TaxID=198213 RepID=A0AAD5ZUU0_9POAL|nr:hypothetical protein LUZ61_008167 [Rhynchospora tenuis]